MTADVSTRPDAEPEIQRRRRLPRPGRRARVILLLALLLLAALIVAWTQRKTIASDYVNDFLAAKGVPVRYEIADFGFDRQRLTNVVIGDPARPDLVADWIELRTRIGFSGAAVTQVRAGQVRLRGTLRDGKVSLGILDRLLPAPSGKPFALPALDIDVADGRMRLETPYGLVGLKLAGKGRLDDGFVGTLAAVSERIDLGGCLAGRSIAALRISIAKAKPTLAGPVRASSVACGDTRVTGLASDVDVALSAALDRWDGSARLATSRVVHPAGRVAALRGTIGFAGDSRDTSGRLDLVTGGFATTEARGGALTVAGDYRIAAQSSFAGSVSGSGVALVPGRLAAVTRLSTSGQGTPVGPLADKLAKAVAAAGRGFAFDSDVTARIGGGAGRIGLTRLALNAASGARATFEGADASYGWPGGGARVAGTLNATGGDLPEMRVALSQAAPGSPVTGTAIVQPYAAGNARIALTPVRFRASPAGNTRFSTIFTLTGPLGDGQIEALQLPIDGLWNGRERLAVNTDCSVLAFRRLAVSGLVLDPARLRLCPVGNALLALNDGRIGGGATIAAPRLAGRLGSTPLTLAAAGSRVYLGRTGFGLSDLAVRLGAPDRVTRLDFARIEGRLDGNTLGGTFTGGGGQIGAVPLVMSAANGDWKLVDGKLGVTGAMTVADAQAAARFVPLQANQVSLTLIHGKIAALGALVNPARGVGVATVVIAHDLSQGSGSADLDVAGITFGDAIQPDDLTPLTVGVIANVEGRVSGAGRIRWTPDDVTSDGIFRTANVDLAAAFGPVRGIAAEIRFTDLLNLESAPGQVATVREINPGIAVNDGRIVYRTLAGTRVQVESGRWPLAGGQLVLEPTLLDFTEAQQRRMTFRVTGMQADQFLQQFEFDNLNATGTFDGSLPMIFDQSGGRIENGRLTMRAGGGTIAYNGEVTKEDVGFWGNFAFQTLRSLRYRNLDIEMNGPLGGEMVTEVRFAGVSQGAGAKNNFIVSRLQKLPFVFNVRITAPFRQLIDSTQGFYDPQRLIERNLPALQEEQERRGRTPIPSVPVVPLPVPPAIPIQPQESRTVR